MKTITHEREREKRNKIERNWINYEQLWTKKQNEKSERIYTEPSTESDTFDDDIHNGNVR